MRIEWEIGNHKYLQELNMKEVMHMETFQHDFDPWFGFTLLDIEAFRQFKKLRSIENAKKIYADILEQYKIIDYIFLEALTDAAFINNISKQDQSAFETEFNEFVIKLSDYLHSKRDLRERLSNDTETKDLVFPASDNSVIKKFLARIQNALNSEKDISSSERKRIIRKSIIGIAKNYSEKSNKYYDALSVIRKRYDIHGIYSYHLARIAVANNAAEDIGKIEQGICERIRIAFANRLNAEDNHQNNNWISNEKINKIGNLIKPIENNNANERNYGNVTKIFRDHFSGNKRCLAIMEFPDNESENMFAVSGIELWPDRTYKNYYNDKIAAPIAAILKDDGGMYVFCRQNQFMRRYTHKEEIIGNNGERGRYRHIDLENWNYLNDDTNWVENMIDYACCERKFIAKLEMDNRNGRDFPQNILLWTRFGICRNCDLALQDYIRDHNAEIDQCVKNWQSK